MNKLFEDNKYFKKDQKYLLAVSGGIDSMVLLNYMFKRKYNLGVIHINHNTRGIDNLKDANLIKSYSIKNKIPYYYYEYKHVKGNFEGRARKFRLEKYKEIQDKKSYTAVILAHHKDDQIENILMNKKKIGYSLMNTFDSLDGVHIIRPMLYTYKNEIYKYMNLNDIKYNEDYTNKDLHYKRNRYRNKLQKLNNEEKDILYSFQEIKELKLDLISNYQQRLINLSDNFGIETKYINTIEETYLFLKKFQLNCNLSRQKLKSILNFIKSGNNGKIYIDKYNLLYIAYNKLYLVNRRKEKNILSEKKLIKGKNKFNDLEFYSKYTGIVKTFKKNDIIKYKFGHKKISRFFIDEKIPENLRKYWPLVYNEQNELIYIPRRNQIKLLKYIGEYNNV